MAPCRVHWQPWLAPPLFPVWVVVKLVMDPPWIRVARVGGCMARSGGHLPCHWYGPAVPGLDFQYLGPQELPCGPG